jgi:hypothetical protein
MAGDRARRWVSPTHVLLEGVAERPELLVLTAGVGEDLVEERLGLTGCVVDRPSRPLHRLLLCFCHRR